MGNLLAYSFGNGATKTYLCLGWDTVHRVYSRLGQCCKNNSTSFWSYWTTVLHHRSGCQHNSFCSTNFFSYLEERKKKGIGDVMGKSWQISKRILKERVSFQLCCNQTLIRAEKVCSYATSHLPMLLQEKKKNFEKCIPWYFILCHRTKSLCSCSINKHYMTLHPIS